MKVLLAFPGPGPDPRRTPGPTLECPQCLSPTGPALSKSPSPSSRRLLTLSTKINFASATILS